LSSRLADLVDEHDRSRPYETGLPVISAARDLGLPAADLVRAVAMGPLRVLEGRVVRDHPSDDELPVLDETVRRIESLLVDNPFAAPTADQLARAGADRKLVARAARSGRLLRLSDAIVLLPDAVDRARGMLAGLRQPFTTAEARVALDTSRRVAVPLLEHLDRLGITKRLADDRREIVKS
jgi:selenocysteine-specific elongation factor